MTFFLLAALGLGLPAAVPALPPAVREAVVQAVRDRVGAAADIDIASVESLSALRGEVVDGVVAPGAVIGSPLAVMLRGRGDGGGAAYVPVGRVSVRVRVTLPHLHTTRAVRRGTRLAEADLTEVRHVLSRGALRALPDRSALAQGRVLRDVPADACLTTQVVVPVPAVVAGHEVAAVVREGGVEVKATLIAIDSGAIGDVVRVAHPETRRGIRARVTGRAEVEIQHEH